MIKLFYFLLIFVVACSGNAETFDNTKEEPHEYYEFYTTDFSYVAVLFFRNSDVLQDGCEIEIDLYETSENFRSEIDEKYTAGEFLPYQGLNSRYDDFDLNLSEMSHMRSIHLYDRIRPVSCVSEHPEDEYRTELKHFRWIEGLEPVLGHSGHVINRADTAFAMYIRHEKSMFYLW
ncbi:hypothetical protein DYD21_20775 [Rhodohalobacter sp. SW132]|uniref:hypothetical protein n=1 Tax=Rhodohalobacter sp. SW132 TaxID=2293433 RepID=UPI000E276BFE|nr:hypothetical protein [Rhodohalobacter sp. SW132]REL23913.1 hypothetical protein DYD21_20775 [Rhodohalobacter sp. SW132]